MIGAMATTSSRRRASTAARTPSTARIGSSEMNGFDGASTMRSAFAIASSTPGAGRAPGVPSKRSARTAGAARRPTNHSWKPSSPSSVVTRVRSRSSVAGSSRTPTPSCRATSAMTADRGSPARRRSRAHEVQADVAVAEDEPVRAAEPADDAEGLAGVAVDAPALLGVHDAGQRVEARVEVGRDVQAEQLDVVADVADDRHRLGADGVDQPEREPRPADATGQQRHTPPRSVRSRRISTSPSVGEAP